MDGDKWNWTADANGGKGASPQSSKLPSPVRGLGLLALVSFLPLSLHPRVFPEDEAKM